MADLPAVQSLSLLESETVPVVGGELQWLPVRRRLGIRAFGTNAYRAARAGDLVVEEHVESPGQEEMYVVIAGAARFTIDGEELVAPAGTVVHIRDPALNRVARASEDGTVVLAVGGWPDRPYHSLPWEPIFLASEAMGRGDWAAETLEREAGESLDTAPVQFRLACCHAHLGEHERALGELRRSIEFNAGVRERAATEPAFEELRGLDGWAAAIA